MAKKKQKIPQNLTKAMLKIKEFLDKNYPKSYNSKTIANNTGLTEGTVRNYLEEIYPLMKRKLIKKDVKGFYKSIQQYFPTLREYIDLKVRDDELREIFIDILENRYPLGIHYINAEKQDIGLKEIYESSSWVIGNYGTFGKDYEIKGIENLGKTLITLWEGKTKGKKPKIRIIYNGENKTFLTHHNYNAWYSAVNVFLKNELKLPYNLKDFDLKQMELNIDLDLSKITTIPINSIKNVKISTLNDIVEIYDYEDEDGGTITRIGRKKFDLNGEKVREDLLGSGDGSFGSIFLFDSIRTQTMNYTVEKISDHIDNMEKSQKAIINQNQKVIEVARETITSFGDSVNKIIEDNKKNLDDFNNKIDMIHNNLLTNFDELRTNTQKDYQQTLLELEKSDKEVTAFKEDLKKEFELIEDREEETTKKTTKILKTISKAVEENANTIGQNSKLLNEFSTSITKLTELNENVITLNDENQKLFIDNIQKIQSDIVDTINQNQSNHNTINQQLTDILKNQQDQLTDHKDSLDKLIALEMMREQRREEMENRKSPIKKLIDRIYFKKKRQYHKHSII